jgi:hypothetical protein
LQIPCSTNLHEARTEHVFGDIQAFLKITEPPNPVQRVTNEQQLKDASSKSGDLAPLQPSTCIQVAATLCADSEGCHFGFPNHR